MGADLSAQHDGAPWTVTSASTSLDASAAARRCFLLQIRPELLAEYVADHQRVWPEMLEALSRTGWRNYSLFLRADDGLVVGYFESADPDAALGGMELEDVNRRWQDSMARYFVPGTSLQQLEQYFYRP
ncbi:L-rhamnose mutarotase [Pengzhenrongella sicca]|uniref:L-rhamnose mutarotase n=1 Tax=Pengzhenrongella sicca TaxID=2819238 RepID=A0A8A4ZKJ3_9MICO|nr:L-rhamnose mutarotase [Pengzhenrongella sicca]QTE30108.1 L-rhamnose mutarotase [Pengzhenrongella sicca]